MTVRRAPAGFAAVTLVVVGVLLQSAAMAEAKNRLRVSATPTSVVAGQTVKVRIAGTRARRCMLTLRADRYRATPFLRRRVDRRSRIRIARHIAPGAKVLVVRCGRRKSHTTITVDSAYPGEETEDEGAFEEDVPPPEDDLFLDDELPPEDEWPLEEEPVEVPLPPVSPDTPRDAQAPSRPAGLAKAAASTSTITLSWRASTDNVRVAGYSVHRSGTRIANIAATSYRFTGLGCGKSYPLGVSAYDAAGNRSATASLTAATAACPRRVSVSKGASAAGRPGCSSSACRFMQVSFSGFSAGSHSVTCRASGGDEGGFYTYTRTGASNTSAVCYYGFPGRSVWVTVDGVASARVTW